MGKFKTPQEKKRLSYQLDRRDDYGESQSSSAKSVRWRKRWVNQTYRQQIKHILNTPIEQGDTDELENQIAEARRPFWKKSPHAPLGLYLYRKGKLEAAKIKKLTFRVREQPVLLSPLIFRGVGSLSGDRDHVPKDALQPNQARVKRLTLRSWF